MRGKETQEQIDRVWEQLRLGNVHSDSFKSGMKWLRENLAPSDSEFMQIAVQEKLLERRG